ncbi:MAG TPA: alpha/beta hydrolase [Gammaproteobacteria bacterium]
MNTKAGGHSRKRWVVVLAAVVVFVNVLALTVGIYVQQVATRWAILDPRKSYAELFGVSDEELARGFDSERFSRLTKERVQLPSAHAETINVLLVHAPGPARGTVLLMGGHPYVVMQVGDIFLDRGFNVLHYNTPNAKISYGYYEKYDLESVVKFAREDPRGIIGVYGMSASAGAAVQYAAMSEGSGDVAFYVIDAGFSDLADLFGWHFRNQVGVRTPWLVNTYATVVSYLRDGYFFGEVSPRGSIVDVRTPMLFVHGRADTEIPYWMTEELYNAKPGAKLLLSHDGGHGLVDARGGGGIVKSREAFGQKVDELLALAGEGGG